MGLTVAALLTIAGPFAAPLDIHVSSVGQDTNPGTSTAPVRTVQTALDLLRQKRKGSMAPARMILDGDYAVGSTVEFGPQDGNLTVDGRGRARLVGGRRLDRWQPLRDADVRARLSAEAGARVLVHDVSDLELGALKRRGFGIERQPAALELFFDHQPMQLARWPNAGEWLLTGDVTKERTFTVPSDRPTRWKPSDDLWAFGYWQFDWAESYEKVTQLAPAARTVEIGAQPPFGIAPKRRFYFLNVLEELDTPGEWYLDRQAKKLYFWPPRDIKKAEVMASTLGGPMIRVANAENVRIQGVDLEAGRDSAIVITGGKGNRVERCRIRNFGTYGVSIDGATDSGVASCDMTGLGEFGISLTGGDRKTLTPGRLYAEDNHIWAFSRWCRTYQPAVLINGVGNRVSHNRIHDAPHNAVLLSGNDHVLEYNDVSRVCTETGDAGAFYMGRDTTMRGNQVRFNRFRDTGPNVATEGNFPDVMSVYLDDCWAGTTIYGNVFEGRGTGIMIGGGRDNTVENNLFVGKKPAIHFDARGKSWAAKYFVKGGEWQFFEKIDDVDATRPPYSTRYPPLATILQEDIAFPKGNRILRNVSLGEEWIKFFDGLSEKDVEYRDNVVGANGTLEEALRRVPKEFQPIPIKSIGLKTTRRPFQVR
jgi:hypothetical protein